MSIDPALALQKALVKRLRDAGVAGRHVYDEPPAGDPMPRVTLGDGQSLADRADCYEGTESFLDIHVWSRKQGFTEAKAIADSVREALDDKSDDIALEGHTLSLFHFESSRALRDPDGKTSHIVMTFRALSQPSD